MVAWILLVLTGALAQAAQPALPRETGTETQSEFFWVRDTNISSDQHIASFGTGSFRVSFGVTYTGLKLAEAPSTVDVLLLRDHSTTVLGSTAEVPPVVAIIDGLPVPLTKQSSEGPDRIRTTVTFEVFQWMVGGSELEFEVFGRRLALIPSQLRVIKQAGAEWAHGISRR